MNSHKILRNIAGWLLAAIIIFFLARTIYIHRYELSQWQWNINWIYILVSFLLLFGAYISATIAWQKIISSFSLKVGLIDSFRILYLSQLGRYIPGKIWQVVGMVALAQEVGVPARISLASFALAQAYSLPASFVLIPIFLGRLDSVDSLAAYRDIFYGVFTIVIIVFLVLFFKPNGLNWALNKVLKILRREPVDYKPDFGNRISIFVWYLAMWFLFGLAFHYFLNAIMSYSILPIGYAIGTYIAAYIIGYISFLSPGGLGFREGVMTALLSPYFSTPVAASISLINRIWITAAEAIISLLALLTYRIKSRK